MIGLALVSFVAVLGKGVRDSLANSFSDQVSRRLRGHVAERLVGRSRPTAGDALAGVPGLHGRAGPLATAGSSARRR